MKRIKEMIETAPSAAEARNMLATWLMIGAITETQYVKGRKLIRAEFAK